MSRSLIVLPAFDYTDPAGDWKLYAVDGGRGRDRLIGGRGRDICLGGPGAERISCP